MSEPYSPPLGAFNVDYLNFDWFGDAPEKPVEHLPRAGLVELPRPRRVGWLDWAALAAAAGTALLIAGFLWTLGQCLALGAAALIGAPVDFN